MSDVDQRKLDFRKALGSFATGVTIVTTRDAEDNPVGVTATSFNSVSLDPPLVLWSLAKGSLSRAAFSESGHFAIHVLAEDQDDISNRFARAGADKFAGVAWTSGVLDSPLLDRHAAVFECRTRYQYEGGDHLIFVGEVVAFDTLDAPPLLFHGGRYAEHRPRPAAAPAQTVDLDAGEFTDDFLYYLIARTFHQATAATRAKVQDLGLSRSEHLVLALLSMQGPADAASVAQMLDHTGHAPGPEQLAAMVARGLLDQEGPTYRLSAHGKEQLIEILAVAQALESDMADRLTRGELSELKRLLRRVIELTGQDVPLGWRL